tara:strand:+ start:20869 stop:21261 length:393 start_codon:yes stop_codon:yes gene_type:complete
METKRKKQKGICAFALAKVLREKGFHKLGFEDVVKRLNTELSPKMLHQLRKAYAIAIDESSHKSSMQSQTLRNNAGLRDLKQRKGRRVHTLSEIKGVSRKGGPKLNTALWPSETPDYVNERRKRRQLNRQ